MAWILDNPSGRFFESRLDSTMTLAEVGEFRRKVAEKFARIPGRVVICGELKQVKDQLFAPEVADGLLALLKSDNPKVERTALVLSGDIDFFLQVERLLTDAATAALSSTGAGPARRSFRDKQRAQKWLAEVLTEPGEQRRLYDFISRIH